MVEKLMDGVFWVGVVDWGLKHFHGHELSTHRGSSYNSYLILDEKIALVDTVWGPFQDDLIDNIREVIDPARIDIVVANHAESDHSGALAAVLRHAPNATLVTSRRGEESVRGHYHQPWEIKTVRTGDRTSLGQNELVFIEAPMLHWPDSMFTYLTGKNLLMSNDAFGQHYATAFRFNDRVNQEELYEEALKYYANILTPFSARVTAKIDEVLALGLPVDMIAPSHGVIWRDDPLQIVYKYKEWAAQVPEKRAVILYDTMWEATRRMGEAIGEGFAAEGVPYKLFHMATTDRNDVLTEVFKAHAVVVGSPTLNGGLLPTITPILEDLKGLAFKNKVGAAFGSYGWSGQAIKRIEEHLTSCGIDVVAEGVRIKWQPTEEDLEQCRDLGRQVAQVMKERASQA
ncbi:MAG TPA: MBL fold metallo-hydrolase [Chloroflexi bacterium]|jgi:anaerobic nitric oxide reductase flavorubredoxin|nr:MBL fold metallo-hydrolase [Chloroflexota bacterium]